MMVCRDAWCPAIIIHYPYFTSHYNDRFSWLSHATWLVATSRHHYPQIGPMTHHHWNHHNNKPTPHQSLIINIHKPPASSLESSTINNPYKPPACHTPHPPATRGHPPWSPGAAVGPGGSAPRLAVRLSEEDGASSACCALQRRLSALEAQQAQQDAQRHAARQALRRSRRVPG